ncbi:response regulator [Rubrivivax rivuli]|uniref:Response regulator n=1 Tax=Rubrivivax rivuli TaxID=1862385 RepID=A0A437RK59_9BURK|nr:response regulator [Rubrivivax rivuli]RVU47147.1 response regulator [Rubrivivax rivuli]
MPPADDPPADSLRVLCVEDNPVNLQLVRELIALRPAVRLRTAEDGLSGVAAAQAEPPELVLLDIQLPDIDGLEVMRRLRSAPRTAGCRIVALSADAMPERIRAALSAGFDDYWTKPIQFDAFLRHLDHLISARAAGQALR